MRGSVARDTHLSIYTFLGEPLRPCESRSLDLESFGRAELRAAHFDGAARRLALCAGTEVWLVDA